MLIASCQDLSYIINIAEPGEKGGVQFVQRKGLVSISPGAQGATLFLLMLKSLVGTRAGKGEERSEQQVNTETLLE